MTRKRTKTSSFGTSKREGHDATQFYSSNLYYGFKINENQDITDHSNELPPSFFINDVEFSIEKLKIIPDYSVHLIIFDCREAFTKQIFDELLQSRLNLFLQECFRILITGGRICLLVDNKVLSHSSEEFQPIHAFLALEMIEIGFMMRGEIIWKIVNGTNSPSTINPSKVSTLSQNYNHILIFSKQVMRRKKDTNLDSISRDQFLQCTKSIWKHPSNLSNEIDGGIGYHNDVQDCYNRLLQLYSFESDKILFIIPNSQKSNALIGKQIRKNIIGFLYNAL